MYRQHRSAAARCLAATLLTVVVALACSKDLARPRAAALIGAADAFKNPLQTKVAIGRLLCDWRNIDGLYSYKQLQESGILAYTDTGIKHGWWEKIYDVGLTSKGDTAAREWTKTTEKPLSCTAAQPDSPPLPIVYVIPLATRELVGVTGIVTNPGGKEAIVDFDWKWAPTPQSAALPAAVPTADVHHAKAEATLYDDGWRISNLDLGS